MQKKKLSAGPPSPAVMRSPRAPCTSDMMHSSTAPWWKYCEGGQRRVVRTGERQLDFAAERCLRGTLLRKSRPCQVAELPVGQPAAFLLASKQTAGLAQRIHEAVGRSMEKEHSLPPSEL